MSYKVISHRGLMNGEDNGIPGNTLEAFEMLLDQLPEIAVETDVRLTKSGLLPVAHDNLLQGFTDNTGFVNNVMTREELRGLKVKCRGRLTNCGVPELDDVLRLFAGRGMIHLELKYGPGDPPGLLDAVLARLDEYPSQPVAISSFNHRALMAVPARLPIGVLTNAMPVEFAAYIGQFTASGQRPLEKMAFHPDIWNLTDEVLAAAQTLGVAINAYTVPPDMFGWCYNHGVNPITDFPMAALEWPH